MRAVFVSSVTCWAMLLTLPLVVSAFRFLMTVFFQESQLIFLSGEGRRVAAVFVVISIDVLAQLLPAGEIVFHAPAANQLRFFLRDPVAHAIACGVPLPVYMCWVFGPPQLRE